MKENKFDEQDVYAISEYGKIVANIRFTLEQLGQEDLELMSNYLKYYSPACMKVSILDLIDEKLDGYKQMDLEDALEE